MKNTRQIATQILNELRDAELRDPDHLVEMIKEIIDRQYYEEALPDGREQIYFIDEEDFGYGLLAHSLKAAHQWLDGFFENLDDNEISVVRFKKQKMTKAEIEAMPEI